MGAQYGKKRNSFAISTHVRLLHFGLRIWGCRLEVDDENVVPVCVGSTLECMLERQEMVKWIDGIRVRLVGVVGVAVDVGLVIAICSVQKREVLLQWISGWSDDVVHVD